MDKTKLVLNIFAITCSSEESRVALIREYALHPGNSQFVHPWGNSL